MWILHVYENFCEIRFLKRRDSKRLIHGECYYLLSKKHIRPANFLDKKKVIFNKKNIITEI